MPTNMRSEGASLGRQVAGRAADLAAPGARYPLVAAGPGRKQGGRRKSVGGSLRREVSSREVSLAVGDMLKVDQTLAEGR